MGGSYYVIRKIVQELEYQSTISSMNTRHDMKLGKVVVKVHETSKKVKEVSGINEDVKTVAGYDAEHGTSVSTGINMCAVVYYCLVGIH